MQSSTKKYVAIISTVALISFAIFLFSRKNKQNPDETNVCEEGNLKDTEKIVLDEEELTSENENIDVVKGEVEKEESREDELEKKYQAIADLAKRNFKEKNFLQAANNYTDLLGMLQDLPSKATERITLLNNRSAMYEKMYEYEKSLEDCNKALLIEINHEKVRLRRARVLRAMGSYDAALRECATIMHLNQEAVKKARAEGFPVTDSQPPDMLPGLLGDYAGVLTPGIMDQKKARKGILPSREVVIQSLIGFNMYATAREAAGKLKIEEITSKIKELQAMNGATSELAAAFHSRARVRIRDLDFDEAYEDLNTVNKLLDDSPEGKDSYDAAAELLSWLGMLWILSNQSEKFLMAMNKCCELEPNNSEHVAKKAGHAMDEGNTELAEELLEQAVELNPKCAETYLVRSQLMLQNGDLEAVKKDLKKCLELKPSMIAAHQRLVLLTLQEGELAKAKHFLERGLKNCGNSTELLMQKGDLLFSERQIDEALDCFDKAIAAGPKRASPHLSKGVCYLQTQPPEFERVFEEFQTAIELDPKLHTAYFQLANLKIQKAKTEQERAEVLELFEKALEFSTDEEELSFIVRAKGFCQAYIDAAKSLGLTEYSLS